MLDVTGKAMDPDRNEQLRAVIRKLVDAEFHGNKSAAAKAFGVSQSYVQEFLGGTRGAGTKFMLGVAAHTGTSVDELMGRPAPPRNADARPHPNTLGAHPNWAAAEAEARRRWRYLTDHGIEMARNTHGSLLPEHVDAELVRRFAEAWQGAVLETEDDPPPPPVQPVQPMQPVKKK